MRRKIVERAKKAQEEMVGFALIIIIVAVILLVFLSFSLRKSITQEPVESYEVSSFINSFLQYTTDCAGNEKSDFMQIREIITQCRDNGICLDERKACDVLNSTLSEIIKQSWQVGIDMPVKAYELKIGNDLESPQAQKIWSISEGNTTLNYKGSIETLGAGNIDVIFNAYY